ncbi:MAG: hypothetical protein JKY19_11930 [Alcanivoracaceae bacterium]|nr:hypothetical protein [Alcanivoracaceae bacterium]
MKIANTIILVLLTLLGISAGVAKLMQMPQEVEFLNNAGLNNTAIILFGVLQVVGGILLIFTKTRKIGALITAIAFAISTVIIFMAGNLAFGFISILPILLAAFVYHRTN